ncbi:MAG: hypothetical protein ACJAVI_001237 [Candidatus Azotimanducaceae bacterium]
MIIISAVMGLFVILHLTLAQSFSSLATLYFQQSGFQAVSVKVGRMGLGRIVIDQLSLTSGSASIDATAIRVGFDWDLLRGRVQAVSISELKIQLDQLSGTGSAPTTTIAHPPDLSSFWSRLTVDVASADHLVILVGQPDLRLECRSQLDGEQATLRLDINSNLMPAKLEANAMLNRFGKLNITLGVAGDPPLLKVSGNPDVDAKQLEITGTLEVSNRASQLVWETLVQEALLTKELVARFTSVVDDIRVKAESLGQQLPIIVVVQRWGWGSH